MTILKYNYTALKKAALRSGLYVDEVQRAINETEAQEKAHNAKMCAYITERRKKNKNYCR